MEPLPKGYRKGAYRQICDECGFKKWSYETRRRWDNMIVCSDTCWEPRHPQDFIVAPIDKQAVANPRPDTDPTYTATAGYVWNDTTKVWE